MKLKHITFTGIDDKIDIPALQNIQREHPYVEFGVLLSWSLQGAERRYPSFQTIRAFCDAGLNLSVHVCGSAARHFAAGNTAVLDHLFAQVGKEHVTFKRMQLNLAGFPAEEFAPLPTKYGPVGEIILQRMSAAEYGLYSARLGDHPSILLDASGGRGIDGPVEILEGPSKVGYAGGLGPDNAAEKLRRIMEDDRIGDCWIDMESHVRTMDWFDIVKVRRVLAACEPVIKRYQN